MRCFSCGDYVDPRTGDAYVFEAGEFCSVDCVRDIIYEPTTASSRLESLSHLQAWLLLVRLSGKGLTALAKHHAVRKGGSNKHELAFKIFDEASQKQTSPFLEADRFCRFFVGSVAGGVEVAKALRLRLGVKTRDTYDLA